MAMNNCVGSWKMLSLEEALHALEKGLLPHPSLTDLECLLSACTKQKNKTYAMRLHAHIRECGLDTHSSIANHLIPLLVSVGNMEDAKQVFDMLMRPNDCSLNCLCSGYIKSGKPQPVLLLYEEMRQKDSVNLNEHLYVFALKACTMLKDVSRALLVHAEIARKDLLESNSYIGTALIDMYSKCGSLFKAQQVFDQLGVRDVVCWNVLMSGYIEYEHADTGFELFQLMLLKGVCPDLTSFICGLKACSSVGVIDSIQEIHTEVERRGMMEMTFSNTLVDIYGKFGLLAEADKVLKMMPSRDIITWTALISGYAEHGPAMKALKCFDQMLEEGLPPDAVTFVCVLKACGKGGAGDRGQKIHADVERHGMLELNFFVARALVDMYVKCGLVASARQVFDRLPTQDVVSWTSLIAGYAEHGPHEEAVKCFHKMQCEGISPDAVSYVCCLKACGCVGKSEAGQEIHADIERRGLREGNLVLGNVLVDMYAKCGLLSIAHEVFDCLHSRDVVSWNALITGYAERGQSEEVVEHYDEMQLEHISPNAATFIFSLKACSSMGDVGGKCTEMHAEVERRGLLKADLVLGSTLVNVYAKCGSMAKAREVFDRLPGRDVIAWNALISGYAEHEHGKQAIKCFEEMLCMGISPNAATYVCSLQACGNIGATEKGIEMHNQVERQGLLQTNLLVGNSLIDMYAKCGSLSRAIDVFAKLPVRDVITWTAIMTGYAQLGEGQSVFDYFERMLGDGIKPNLITFLVVLGACSHMGLYHRSQTYFDAMSKEHGMDPKLEHQNCLVDLFSRVGQLEKAVMMVTDMPVCPNLVVWRSVLGACKKWGSMEFAKQAFEHAVGLDQKNAVAYLFMSHVYGGTKLEVDTNKVGAKSK